MILESVVLNVRPGQTSEFEDSFREAETILAGMPGYLGHALLKCIETDSRYLLLVRWRKLEDHTEGFRGAPEYARWRALLHHFYDPFPTVEHYQPLEPAGSS